MKRILYIKILFICIVISCNNLNSNKEKSEASASKSDSLNAGLVNGIDYADLGFKLMDSETIGGIKRGMTFENVKALIGEPDTISTIDTSEMDGGLYQSVDYPKLGVSIVITLNPDSVKKVENILVTELCTFKTSKQIGIGSSLDELKKAYSESINPEFSGEDYVVAGTIYGGIVFNLENLKVRSIYIGISAD